MTCSQCIIIIEIQHISPILTLIIQCQRNAVSIAITQARTIYHRHLKTRIHSCYSICRVGLYLLILATRKTLLVLKHSTQHHRMFAKSMEQLHAISQTQTIHMQVITLLHRLQSGIRKSQCTLLSRLAEHIVHIRTQCYPIADIHTQTAIHLRKTTFSTICLGKLMPRGSRIGQRKIITNSRIRCHTYRHRYIPFPQRKLHRDILQVAIQAIALTIHIAIVRVQERTCYIKHKRQRIATCVRSWLRRVNRFVRTHTRTYSTHRTISTWQIVIQLSISKSRRW